MKISTVFTGALIASAATSRNQSEARLPSARFSVPVSRGLCTGALSTGVKNIVNGWKDAFDTGAAAHNQTVVDVELSSASNTNSSGVVRKAMRNFPLSFGSNAVATTYVDRLFSVPRKATVKNIAQLALPIASMELTKEVLSETRIPKPAKEALAVGAFWAGAIAQGKAPVTTALSVSGFVAGASMTKAYSNRPKQKQGVKVDLQSQPVDSVGVSASAASGFMSPASSRSSDQSSPASYDDYIRQRYRLKEDAKFWEGPDGSVFVPLDSHLP